MKYEKLFLCSGLEPDYSQVEGLLYALDDSQNNLFSSYHFEKGVSKMSVFTHCMKKRLINFQKLTQKDINFIDFGFGKIIFSCLDNNYKNIIDGDKFFNLNLISCFYSNFLEAANNIIILYDLLKQSRKDSEPDKYILSNYFAITIPYSKQFFLDNLGLKIEDLKNENLFEFSEKKNYDNIIDTNKYILTDFLIQELEKRNIEILWEHKLKKISLNNKLFFENCKEIDYNFCYVTPNLRLPNIIKYGMISENNILEKKVEKKTENEKKENFIPSKTIELGYEKFEDDLFFDDFIDYNKLELIGFEDIYVLGDTLKNFYDRQYHNVYLQAYNLANNVKVDVFNLKKIKKKNYVSNKSIFIDYNMMYYLFVNNGKIKLLKKNFVNKYYIESFYVEQENKYMLKYFLKNKLGIKLNLLK